MARKTPEALIRHAGDLVLGGAFVKEAAAAIGCNPDELSRKLRDLGIDTSVGLAHKRIKAAREARFANMTKAAYDGSANPAVGVCERELSVILENNGFDVRKQLFVDGYMIDIAIGNIAVEVISKERWTPYSYDIEIRTKELTKHDFRFVFVRCRNLVALERNADNLVAAFRELRRNPPGLGEYRVIRCSFNDAGNSDYEIDEFAIERHKRKS